MGKEKIRIPALFLKVSDRSDLISSHLISSIREFRKPASREY